MPDQDDPLVLFDRRRHALVEGVDVAAGSAPGRAQLAEDIGVGLLGLGGGQLAGPLDRRLDPRRRPRRGSAPAPRRSASPRSTSRAAADLERVALAPGGRLLLGLVGLGVALVVAVPAVGLGLDQEGAAAVAAARGGVARVSA